MGILEQYAESGGRVTRFLPALAGLVVAAWVADSVCLVPTRFLSGWQLLRTACDDVLVVSLASVITVTLISVILARTLTREFDHLVIQTSLAALWLAPLALFVHERSFWTLLISAAFAIAATRLFGPAPPPAGTPSESLILSLNPDGLPLSHRSQPFVSVAAAFCVQIAVLAAADGRMLSAAALAGVAFSVWTWTSPRFGPSPSTMPAHARSQSPHLPIAALAVVATLLALFPFLRIPGSHLSVGYLSRGHRPVPTGDSLGPRSRPRAPDGSAANGEPGDSGVILWPTKPVITQLVVPPPMHETHELANGHHADPLIIPFDGVYWYFKSPDVQPPKSSRQMHVSPETVNIRSVDHRPLSIEAHDHLANLISLNCCSRIQVALRNADRYPESVTLEVVLINTSVPSRPQQSLGIMMVRSTHPWDIYDEAPPVSETLNFAIPSHHALSRFDEVKVVFRLDHARADAGAKMAIDHFVLIPRGL